MNNLFEENKDILELYSKYWGNFLYNFENLSEEAAKTTMHLMNFCISRNKRKSDTHKYLFHFMLIIGINATDALPAYDNLYYHVLHSIWVADSKIDGTSKHFSKKCAHAREAVLEKVSDALYDKEEFPPFGKPYLWKDIENTIFKIKESSSINHRLINNHFYFNYKGECITKKGCNLPLPSLAVRKSLCRSTAKALSLQVIQDTLLSQKPCKADRVNRSWFVQTIPPLHIGWTEELEAPTLYGMNLWGNDAVGYGNAFVRFDREKINPSSYRRLLELVPPETAIPLLAYSLFSIIKFFIPGYPSRISADEPFRTVNKKMDKLIFLSLKGEDAEALADAFCGAFSDYGEEYKNIDWRYRVHDGVVIYNKKFKNLNQFRTHELLQDACVLCVNPDFEHNDQEIILQTNAKLTAEEYQEVREIVEGLLLYFIKLFHRGYINQQNDHISNAKDNLWYTYKNLYSNIHKLWLGPNASIESDLNELYSEYMANIPLTWEYLKLKRKQLMQALRESVTRIYNNMKISPDLRLRLTAEPHYSTSKVKIEQYENKTPGIQKQKRNFLNGFFALSKINKAFSTEIKNHKNQISKYIYLTSAMNLFCITLQASKIPKEDTEKLMNLSLNIFKTMAQSQENMATPQQVLNQYLSSKITKQHIIPVRTQSDTEISGWYDSKKDLIYLPYKTYFDSINQYWEEQNHISLPYEQKAFQATLSKEGILLTKKNGKTNYNRPDYKIVVAPADSGTQYKETVIKIQVDRLSLGKSVYDRLEELSEIPVKRRSKSK